MPHLNKVFVRTCIACGIAVLFCGSFRANKSNAESPEFATITARGRMLAEYDVAAWHSTDAVMALPPKTGSVRRYVAKKTENGWVVAYGHFSEDHSKFLIVYEAVQGASADQFTVKEHDPPQEDTGFFFVGAKGIETVLKDYPRENRPYNVSVLSAESNQIYVYIVPAQTKLGTYPLGGDARYLISSDGVTIVEKRQLHKTILDMTPELKGGERVVAGNHTHVVTDVPEDTDVFYVLTRRPLNPEYIITEKHLYSIGVDGTILVVK